MDIQFPYSFYILIPTFLLVVLAFIYSRKSCKSSFPKSYPLIGSSLEFIRNRHRIILWISEIFQKSSSSTITLQGPLGVMIFTISPSNIQHILKTRINLYQKESSLKAALSDFFGNGLFLVDGKEWKSQRQILGHDYVILKGYRIFVQSVAEKELSGRLLPFLRTAAMNKCTLDLQETFRRLTYDLVFQIGFSYDLEYLLPSFPPTPFALEGISALYICIGRYITPSLIWKAKKLFNIKTEKRLKLVVNEIQEFVRKIIKGKIEKLVMTKRTSINDQDDDLCDRIMKREYEDKKTLDEAYYVDSSINFILAGQETLSSALTWFFWLVSTNHNVEMEIVKEIKEKDNDWKEMVYTHASICESMRLYPPVPIDGRQATDDDVWPDGTKVKKGMTVCLHIHAMGRSEELWGSTWAEFRPERWLNISKTGEWRFIPRDPFTYPIFLAGPRTCLGKEVAFTVMKMIDSAILKHFRVVPSIDGYVPSYSLIMTSKMKKGFPVRIMERC